MPAVGCGKDRRHSEAGFEAVGLDASPHQFRHARRNAPATRLVKADVRPYRLPRRFDVITCMFDSLNDLTRRRDLERAFRRFQEEHIERGPRPEEIDESLRRASLAFGPHDARTLSRRRKRSSRLIYVCGHPA